MSIIHGVECLRCGCPARIEPTDVALWSCPMCGNGFVCVSARP